MEIRYKSTRGNKETITASEAILKGLADDGGLYVPTEVPALDVSFEDLAKMHYREVAYLVMSKFFSDFTEEELKACINNAYDSKFDTEEIAPLVSAGKYEFLELFHGATIAFKDMALSILPHLLTTSARKNKIEDEIVILTATSGDTGKAALSGFADVPGTKIIVFYPKGGVSRVQELQMVTQKGDNTFVVGVHGNFDDAQTGVKKMFNDSALKAELKAKHFLFSSANSINIGRLIPQVAYYVWAYGQMVKKGKVSPGEPVNFDVPTGNFGNILAGYFAKQMGLPVRKLICASNDNKVLYDFFKTGVYDREREFILTSSPSMDILISSNLERLIYLITGQSEEQNRAYMKALRENGRYEISAEQKGRLDDFYGGFATEAENAAGIKRHFEEFSYITDTHTGVAACVYDKYVQETGDTTPTVIVSTASPYKFARSVMTAIDPSLEKEDDFALIEKLHETGGVAIPQAIREIMNADVRHKTECEIDGMEATVRSFLGI